MHGRAAIICLLVLASVVLCSLPPRVRSQDSGKTQIAAYKILQDKWLLQSREVDGSRGDFPDGVYKLFTKDRMMQTFTPVESTEARGPTLIGNRRFRIGVGKEFPTIDAWGKADMTDITKGIFRLDNDTLTLCWSAKSQPRPTKFTTGAAAGGGKLLETYRRAGD